MTDTSLPSIPDASRWESMDFMAQMANIGSEVGRNNASASSRDAMLREVLLARDQFCEEYLSDDINALARSERYFSHFAKACAVKAGR